MSTTTTNFGLLKPGSTDPADITKFNENWDKIDRELLNSREIFIAEVNVTSYEELNNAAKAGKTIFCKKENLLLPLVQYSVDSSYFFGMTFNNVYYLISVMNLGNGYWAVQETPQYTYGTTDLTAGESALETGRLYFVYE